MRPPAEGAAFKKREPRTVLFCTVGKNPDILRRRSESLSRTIATIFGTIADHKILETPVIFDKSILMEMATNTFFN